MSWKLEEDLDGLELRRLARLLLACLERREARTMAIGVRAGQWQVAFRVAAGVDELQSIEGCDARAARSLLKRMHEAWLVATVEDGFIFDMRRLCTHAVSLKVTARGGKSDVLRLTVSCGGCETTLELVKRGDVFETDEPVVLDVVPERDDALSKVTFVCDGTAKQILTVSLDDETRGDTLVVGAEPRWRRVGHSSIELLLGAALAAPPPRPAAAFAGADDDVERDWTIHVEPQQLQGIQEWLLSNALGPLSSRFHLDHLLTLGLRIVRSDGSRTPYVKSQPHKMDHATHGAVFSKRLTASTKTRRAGAMLEIALFRRLASDMADAETLGTAQVRLDDIPFQPFGRSPPSAPWRSVVLRRGKRANGRLRALLWMQPTHYEAPLVKAAGILGLFVALLLWAWLSLELRWTSLFVATPFVAVAASLAGPTLLGRALTAIVDAAAPGLNMEFGAVRFFLYVYKGEDKSGREVVLAVDVDDVRIRNDPTARYNHRDFVACRTLRLSLSFDMALAQNAVDCAYYLLRDCFKGRQEGDVVKRHVVLSLSLQRPKKDSVYLEIISNDSLATLAATEATSRHEWCVTLPYVDEVRVKCFVDNEMSGTTRPFRVASSSLVETFRNGDVLRCRARTETAREAPRRINWSAFPTVHNDLRQQPGFEPTRLATVVVRELHLEGVSLAFDSAQGDFNVNRLTRTIAEGKVRKALPRKLKQRPPNMLEVTVVGVRGVAGPDSILRTRVTVRDAKVKTSAQKTNAGRAIWNHTMCLPCPDPSAVVHVTVHRDASFGKVVGQWITTAKMLVLAPTNVFGRDLEHGSTQDGHYYLGGWMKLRSKNFNALASEIELRLRWYHDPKNGLSQADLLSLKPLTALEQINQNSLETSLKLGNLKLVAQMLEDFPLLFDVRSLQISHVICHLKALFMGHQGESNHAAAEDHIAIDKLDFRDKLHAGTGITLAKLARLFVTSAVTPVLSQLHVFAASRHILSGVYVGLFSSASLASTGDDEDDDDEQLTKGRASMERLRYSIDTLSSNDNKYLAWGDQEALLRAPQLRGLLFRRVVTAASGLGLGRRTSKWSLVWCELRDHKLYYTKVQPDGQSRVGFTKLVDLEADKTQVSTAGDTLVLRYHPNGAPRPKRIALAAYAAKFSTNPSLQDWHAAFANFHSQCEAAVPVEDEVAVDSTAWMRTSLFESPCALCGFVTTYYDHHDDEDASTLPCTAEAHPAASLLTLTVEDELMHEQEAAHEHLHDDLDDDDAPDVEAATKPTFPAQ